MRLPCSLAVRPQGVPQSLRKSTRVPSRALGARRARPQCLAVGVTLRSRSDSIHWRRTCCVERRHTRRNERNSIQISPVPDDDHRLVRYPNEIGPGVYDMHSPRVPSVDEMKALLDKAASVIAPEQIWVNPDCGLKTRGWPEVEQALENMVAAAQWARHALVRAA